MRVLKIALCFSVLVLQLCGCAGQMNNTTAGTLTGGTLGAGLGAIIGSTTGHAGPGIAIGAAAGALSGALIGNSVDANERENEAIRQGALRQQESIDANRRLLDELRSRGADARISDRGVVINLPDVLFEFDRADLTYDAGRTVQDIADVLQRTPDRTISIEGHTDSIGSDLYNQRLSERRAQRVAEALDRSGVRPSQLRVHGYGESNPIASNESDVGRARNRRVEVIVENASPARDYRPQ